MNILYTCDNNYAWIMGISMISLFENNKEQKDLKVYVLGDHISADNKFILIEIAKSYNRVCSVIDVPELNIPDILCSQRWPISAFTRLFCGQLMPGEIERVLYLDCDTIIENDISELWKVDMQGNIFCGIKDCVGKTYKKNIGLRSDALYVNAGVLLIDMNKLRELDISDSIEQYLHKYMPYINYADQDILNGIFSSNIGVLPPEYNVMTLQSSYSYDEVMKLRFPTNYYSKNEVQDALEKPRIIHYTTCMLNIRPWFSNANHPYTAKFRKYMDISPWKNVELNRFEFKTKEVKVLSIIKRLPYKLAIRILGIIHSQLKPMYINTKAKVKR